VIVASVPLRISLLGGGTDMPAYLNQEHRVGCCLSLTIDKYVHVCVAESGMAGSGVRLTTPSGCEDVESFDLLKHRLTAEILKRHAPGGRRCEVGSFADLPVNGTGLGGSSAYAVGLIACLDDIRLRDSVKKTPKSVIAQWAYEAEVVLCGQPIGKQDQFACATTGLNRYDFYGPRVSDLVGVIPVNNFYDTHNETLTSWIHLYYIGGNRSASEILARQSQEVTASRDKLHALDRMRDLAQWGSMAVREGKYQDLANMLHESWMLKRTLTDGITNDRIDALYERARSLGAVGGKVLGAGSGGYMAFMVPPEKALDFGMGMPEDVLCVPFKTSDHVTMKIVETPRRD